MHCPEFSMIVLLIAAIAALAAGVLAILYGVPVKEFSFGNTIILAGVMGVCTGLVLFGLWVAVREIRAVARRIAAPAADGLHEPSLPELSASPSKPPFPAKPSAREPAAVVPPVELEPAFPPFEQTRIEDHQPPPEATPALAATNEPPKPRRNLLFESSVRKDRERAEPASTAAPPPVTERTVIDDPIAQRAAERADRLQRTRAPAPFAESPKPAPTGPTVLKSGVVDGMSYSLYSDGSIEAQMPEGMMRFASIDELRSHLDQRGA